jgi:hypothetical protein
MKERRKASNQDQDQSLLRGLMIEGIKQEDLVLRTHQNMIEKNHIKIFRKKDHNQNKAHQVEVVHLIHHLLRTPVDRHPLPLDQEDRESRVLTLVCIRKIINLVLDIVHLLICNSSS